MVRFKIHSALYSQFDFIYLGPTAGLPTPFPLNGPSQTESTAIPFTLAAQKPQFNPISKDKSTLPTNPFTTSVSPLPGSQPPYLIIDAPNPQVPSVPIISPPSDPTSEIPQRDGSPIRQLFTNQALNGSSVNPSALPSSVNTYDNPPPSYWRNDNDGQSGRRPSGTATPGPS